MHFLFCRSQGRLTIMLESVALDTSDILSVKRKYSIPSPTILFIKPDHLTSLVTAVIKESARSWLLYPFGWRHKLTGVTEGFITRESLWDRVVFDGARTKILGEGAATLRGVIVSGGRRSFIYYCANCNLLGFRTY